MLIGHEKLVEDFKRLAQRSELSHGYLFSGSARVGKKLFAVSFANFLETGDFNEPKMLSDALFLDPPHNRIMWGVEPNKKRTIGIDEIRSIRNFLWQKPIVSRKRTVVINDAEAMTGEAENAVLKIAEEPPESSLLILIARDSEKLLPTLQSRLQKVHFSSVPQALIEDWLSKQFGGDRQKIKSAAMLSSGQPGLAWRMLFDERFKALWKSGESFLKSGFWARREAIKALLEPDDFNLGEFLEVLLLILSFDRPRIERGVEPSQGKRSQIINFALWHRILDLRKNADYLNLNPRLQLESLMNET